MSKKKVLVTGFGPFGQHTVNASWECAKQLKEIGLGEGIDLVIEEIAVEYDTVQQHVPQLWQSHEPDLVVHIGVSGVASQITLEQRAHNTDYQKEDVKGKVVNGNVCVAGAKDCIVAELDMSCICAELNDAGTKVKAVVSNDAGRYLCDFSYFTSLHINPKRSAFIHVPVLNKPFTAEELAEGLKVAILCMLKQIDQNTV